MTSRFKHWLYSVIIFVLVSGCCALLYLIVLAVPSDYTRFDLSENRLYSLSEQSILVAENIENPVGVYLICTAGKEDERLTSLLEQFRKHSALITVQYVDPALEPDFVPRYTSSQLQDNSLIITGPGRSRVIRYTDIYVTDYDYDTGRTAAVFDGEGQITSGLAYADTGSGAHIYVLSGHSDQDLGEALAGMMAKEGMTVEYLNLKVEGAVPDDCDSLMLIAPTADLTEAEANLLISYLETGGRMLLLTSVRTEEMPYLDYVLSAYGVAWEDGVIVEGNSNYYVPSYSTYLLPEFISHEITDPLIEAETMVLQPMAHGIRLLEECRSTVQIQGLTSATDQAYTQEGAQGPFITGAAVSEMTAEGETRLVWLGCYNIIVEDVDEIVGGSNTDMVLNSLGWLAQQENSITVRPKAITEASLVVPAAQAAGWGIVWILAVPLAVVLTGAAVCIVRRRRK